MSFKGVLLGCVKWLLVGKSFESLPRASKSPKFLPMLLRGFSIPKLIVGILVLSVLVGMGLHVVFSWVPRPMDDIDGYVSGGLNPEKVVDLKEKLEASIEGDYEVTVTEEEINRYLAAKLKLEQSKMVSRFVNIKGVYVDLKPDVMELIIERDFDYDENVKDDGSKLIGFLPFQQTVSMELEILTIEDEKGGTARAVNFPGANFGTAPAPGLFVKVVKPSFDAIHEHFSEEVDLAYAKMARIKINDGHLILDPRRNVKTVTQPWSRGLEWVELLVEGFTYLFYAAAWWKPLRRIHN